MPEQYDRLIEGSRLIHFRLLVQSLDAPSDFDRFVSGYRLTQTALLGGPLLYTCLFFLCLPSDDNDLFHLIRCYVARRLPR